MCCKYDEVKKEVYEFLKQHMKNGRFQSTRQSIADNINSNGGYVGKVLKELEKEGKIKLIQEYNYSTYEPAIWEIIQDEEKNNDLKYDYITKDFEGQQIKIYNTEKGAAISVEDLSFLTKKQECNIYCAIKNHLKEYVICNKNTNINENIKNTLITKNGVITIITILAISSYSKIESKKIKLLELQYWVINDMNFGQNTKEQDVDDLFEDLENTIINKIKNIKNRTKEYKEEVEYTKLEMQTLKNINNKYRVKTLQLQDRIRDLM